MQQLTFYLVLAFLFTHEMDAVMRYEWRLLPILRNMPERRAANTFIWLHVPLFALFIWLGTHSSDAVRIWFQTAVDLFAMIHIWLHFLFRNHPEYRFDEPISIGLIWGAGAFGLIHLVMLWIL